MLINLLELGVRTLLVEDGLAQSDSYEEIRCMVSSALQNQCRVESNDADCYCWIQNMYPASVVYSMDGKSYMRSYAIDAKDNVTFGTASEVEMSWQPVQESAKIVPITGKKSRLLVAGRLPFKESAYESATGTLSMTVIQPGFNKGKDKFYPADVLRRDCNIFEGAKMFMDHATPQESQARPEGSVRNWVASINKVWAESDGRVRAQAVVIDPPFKAKLEELAKANLLADMGVSIRAIGEAQPMEVEGTNTLCVESLLAARSVDFVTFAGAGGQVEAIEAAPSENDLDLISLTQLRARRPDLVTLLESEKEKQMDKSKEQQLQEANTTIKTLTAERDGLLTKVQEAENKQAKATAAAELTKLLSESKLPEKAQDRIRKQFAEAVKADGMKDAILSEQEYIKGLGVTAGSGTSAVQNMGEKENGSQESATEASAKKPNMVESFQHLGLTEAEAKIAAKF